MAEALASSLVPSDYLDLLAAAAEPAAANTVQDVQLVTLSALVLTGVAAGICVLFTAADAHMRAYDLWVPSDTVASLTAERTGWALGIMEKSMGADTRPTGELALDEWIKAAA